jgi:predicted enzyme related to lactoylglutathione lyase
MRLPMREGSGGLLLLVPLVLAATACASGGRGHIPPLTLEPTGTYTVGRFVWYDLLSDDVPAVKQFYGTLFGWEFEGDYGDEGDFTLITHHGQPIGGIVYAEPLEDGVSRSRWIPSLSVADVDQAVDQVRQSGGTVYFQPEDVPDRGRISVVGDPQGAIVAFVRTTSGDPVEVDPPRGGWLWTELWTRDVEAAVEFYRSLVGYEYEIIAHAVLGDYGVLKRDGDARAGVRKIPWEDVMPNWLPS